MPADPTEPERYVSDETHRHDEKDVRILGLLARARDAEAEVARLRDALDIWNTEVERLQTINAKDRAEVERLREALRFYADPASYDWVRHMPNGTAQKDRGALAREALRDDA